MAVIHISEDEAARDFPGLLARLRAGEEFVIQAGTQPIARLQPAVPPTRTIAQCIALLDDDSPGVMDDDFARAVEEAIETNQQPFVPPAWD